MGIIKAAADAVRGAFADQWLEVIEPGNMGDQTVFFCWSSHPQGPEYKGDAGSGIQRLRDPGVPPTSS